MSGKADASDALRGWSRRHVFDLVALLLPCLGLAVAAALKSAATPADLTLAYGGRSTWTYPPFLLRAIVAYGIVIVWLMRQLRRRSFREFEALLWQAPIAYVVVSVALMSALVLAHGHLAQFADQHTGLIGVSLAVHLALGFGYLGLIVLARRILEANGYFVEDTASVAMSDQGKPEFSTATGS